MSNITNSVWSETASIKAFKPLQGPHKTGVLIIGGGMAGVLCAYYLHQRGIDYTLVEAKTLGSGITKNTTAVLSAQHDTLYTDLAKKMGVKQAELYLRANLQAVSAFGALCKNLDCDYQQKSSYMYTKGDPTPLQQEVQTLRSFGYPAQYVTQLPLPFPIQGAVCYPDQAQFHPLKFIDQICTNLHICEHTVVKKIQGHTVYTNHGIITADKIIVATHFPLINTSGLYMAKMYQMRSFVLALKNAPPVQGTYVDYEKSGMYFRDFGDLLLVGGGDHPTGKKGGGFDAVRDFVSKHYPNSQEAFAWSTQDCMSLDGVPYVGVYSKTLPHVYVATGFNEWGMSSSMVAANLLCDMVQGKTNPYEQIYKPSRSMIKPQLFANLGTTMINFVNPCTKRCPHLGCALVYNRQEHSWDCPCHGSRFEKDGRLIDNPAMRDAKIKK